ncbi:hypothetical protein BWI97_20045 [Siphonobacter sp. BAB-5405]|uniref:hypothetical protein n=1 Tax=Siphonobacter sp. BAB-5405 TaxID=1864825 RepID=UPI000C80D28D|nr:hypothetical protein [Siphonobacter sp. BAB-5405]PMD92388.1 hypothetical protein BWI97_20045 [Siphonobacter sp. BAB-5405]
MKATFTFELYSYFRKPGFYISLALALLIGYFIGSQLTFSPGKELTRYGSYALTHLTGLFNLAGIFITAFFSAQVFFSGKRRQPGDGSVRPAAKEGSLSDGTVHGGFPAECFAHAKS